MPICGPTGGIGVLTGAAGVDELRDVARAVVASQRAVGVGALRAFDISHGIGVQLGGDPRADGFRLAALIVVGDDVRVDLYRGRRLAATGLTPDRQLAAAAGVRWVAAEAADAWFVPAATGPRPEVDAQWAYYLAKQTGDPHRDGARPPFERVEADPLVRAVFPWSSMFTFRFSAHTVWPYDAYAAGGLEVQAPYAPGFREGEERWVLFVIELHSAELIRVRRDRIDRDLGPPSVEFGRDHFSGLMQTVGDAAAGIDWPFLVRPSETTWYVADADGASEAVRSAVAAADTGPAIPGTLSP